MIRATLSILGLYDYDNTLFDYFTIPDGIDKDDLITLIFSEASSFELLYPSGPIMKNLIGVWSRKMLPIWDKLKYSTEQEYNPIYNYDRFEEETTSGTNSGTSNITSGSTHTESGSVTYGRTDTDVNQVAGFNSETFANSSKSTNTASGSDSNSSTGGGTANETQSATANEKQERTLRAYGNIGVTTAPEMLKEYREIEDYSIYDKIAWDFIDKFCVRVY